MRNTVIFLAMVTFAALAQPVASQPIEGDRSAKADQPNPGQHQIRAASDPLDSLDGTAGASHLTSAQPSTDLGQEKSRPEQDIQPSRADADHNQWTVDRWFALVALLANIPTWFFAARYGGRQARAAEAANNLAALAAKEARRSDVRWTGVDLLYSSLGEGKNLLTAGVKNYGTRPITLIESDVKASVDGVPVKGRVSIDADGILDAAEGTGVQLDIRLSESQAQAVHDGIARLEIRCKADFMDSDNISQVTTADFVFFDDPYLFRLSHPA